MGHDELMDVISADILKEYQAKEPFYKLSEVVYKILEDAIVSCRIKPGSQLNTARIADLMGVSRTPVRDAMEQLADVGLVLISPRKKGYYVFDISHSSLENLIDARKAIENYAAFMCAEHSGNVDIERLQSLAKEFDNAIMSGDYTDFAAIDHDFHHLIVGSCGNAFLQSMYDSLERIVKYTSYRIQEKMSAGGAAINSDLANQHMAICNAIALGMPDLAFRASDRHLDTILILCLKYHSFADAAQERELKA